MKDIDVSIIIINYNTFDLTCNCIESIIEKTREVKYEIIVVDNASPDKNAGLFLERFQDIILVQSETNAGFAAGNNLGIRHASGQFLLLLNSDTLLINDAVSLSFGRLKREPEIAALSAQLLNEDGSVQHPAGNFMSISLELIKLFHLKIFLSKEKATRRFLGFDFDHQVEMESDWIWGTFFMIRRSVVDKMPGSILPETYFMYCEDMEWGYLIHKMGYKLLFFPDAKVIHYGGKSGGQAEQYIQQNQKKLLISERGRVYSFIYFILARLNGYKRVLLKGVKKQ